MKIVEPYARMLNVVHSYLGQEVEFRETDGIVMLRNIEYIARVSHRSEDRITEDSYDRFLRSVVLGHGDWSVTEHEKVTCEFLVDRGITHELVRHRIGSYTQESTRFVNYQKQGGEASFICPVPELSKALPYDPRYSEWVSAMGNAEKSYMALLADSIKPQIARSVLPNALASKIVVTYNLRTWRHFFVMRTCAEAHPQMRQVVDPLLAEFRAKIPILYEDIVPGERQAIAMTKPR